MTLIQGVAVLITCALAASAAAVAAHEEEPPPPDTFVAVPMSAPSKSIKEACAALDPGDHGDSFTCKDKKLAKRAKPLAPFKALGLATRKSHGFVEELLAIQTDAGWHVTSLMMLGTDYGGRGSVTISSVKIKDVVPGGTPEVIITGKRKTSYESSSYIRYGDTYELLWVCGVGTSGTPSCAEITLGIDFAPSDMNEEATRKFKLRLGYKFGKDGSLKRTVKGKWPRRALLMDGEEPLARTDFENTRWLLFP